MIINSTYHDYYDMVAKTVGVDKTLVFNRDTSSVYLKDIYTTLSSSLIGKLENCRPVDYNWTSHSVHDRIVPVVFCGKVYWIKRIQNEDGSTEYEPLTEDVKISRFRWDRSAASSDLVKQYDMTELNIALNSSIVMLLPSISRTANSSIRDIEFVVYPHLRKYNFQKIVDPYSAYQEIQMFNFGVLSANKEPEQLADKSRIVAAGFDLKTSFRNTK